MSFGGPVTTQRQVNPLAAPVPNLSNRAVNSAQSAAAPAQTYPPAAPRAAVPTQGYAPAPARIATPARGYSPAPARAPVQGYGPAPAPAPTQGYGPAPAPAPTRGYAPAPARSATPARGYSPAPARTPTQGYGPAPAPTQDHAPAPVFSPQEVAEFEPLYQRYAKVQITMEQILAGFGGSMQKLDRFKDYLRSQMKKLSKEEIEFFYPIYFSHRTGQINVQTVALQCGREKFGRFKEAVAQLEEIYQLWIQSQKIERLENEKREHEMKAEQHGQRAEQHGQRAEQHGQRADEYGRQMAEHAHRAAEYGQQAQIHDAQMRQHQANVATLTMYSNHLARQNQHAEQAIIDSRHATVQQLRTLGMKP